MSNTEQPIEVGTGNAPAQDSAPAAVPVAPATSTSAKSDDGGMLSAYMPAEVPPCGMKPGVCLLFALLIWVLLFEFCAICVSDKLTVADNDSKCGWEKACATIPNVGSTCTKYSDMSGDDAKTNKDAGNTFIGMGILSFFLLIAMIPIVCDIHFKFCAGFQTFVSSWTLNLIFTAILWLFMTVAWGHWVSSNTCKDADGAKHGDGTNLMITAWFFLTFFYVPLSVPMLQRMLFGDNACESFECKLFCY